MVLDITTDLYTRVVADTITGEFNATDLNGVQIGGGVMAFQPVVRMHQPLVMGAVDGAVENYGLIERVIYRQL